MIKWMATVGLFVGVVVGVAIGAPAQGRAGELICQSEPEPMSCKASGHACQEKDDCCSRMCLKSGKCG